MHVGRLRQESSADRLHYQFPCGGRDLEQTEVLLLPQNPQRIFCILRRGNGLDKRLRDFLRGLAIHRAVERQHPAVR